MDPITLLIIGITFIAVGLFFVMFAAGGIMKERCYSRPAYTCEGNGHTIKE